MIMIDYVCFVLFCFYLMLMNYYACLCEVMYHHRHALHKDVATQRKAVKAKEFGLAAQSLKTSVDELALHSLPCPGIAILFPETMESNFKLIDQRYVRPEGFPKRSLVMLGNLGNLQFQLL